MSKELSKQICEKCEIPYEKEITDPLYKSMCDRGDPRCTQISSTKKAVLDFGQPENFCKLVNIQRDLALATWGETGDGIHKSFHKRFKSYEEEVISHLLWILKEPPTPSEYGNKFNTFQKQLKQVIKEAEWIYA